MKTRSWIIPAWAVTALLLSAGPALAQGAGKGNPGANNPGKSGS